MDSSVESTSVYRPMPKSKKREREKKLSEKSAKELLENAVLIPASSSSFSPAKRPSTMIIYSEDESEYSEESSCYSDDPDHVPDILPETIDVPVTDEFAFETPLDAEDVLGGADVYKDFKPDVVEDTEEPPKEPPTEEEKAEISHEDTTKAPPIIEADDQEGSSDSSLDLVDLEFNFTDEEMREIKRKRKLVKKERKRLVMEQQAKKNEEQKKGRFYDKSRDLPGEIYFGDIKVPLHVLYSYKQPKRKKEEEPKIKYVKTKIRTQHPSPAPEKAPTSVNSVLGRLVKYLETAGAEKTEYELILDSDASFARKYRQLMNILRAMGLQGDPTLAKCREIRGLQRESDLYLDTSVIINPNGRTLRSGTTIREEEEVMELPEQKFTTGDVVQVPVEQLVVPEGEEKDLPNGMSKTEESAIAITEVIGDSVFHSEQEIVSNSTVEKDLELKSE